MWRERARAASTGIDRATFVAEADDRWIGMATGLALGLDEPEPTLVAMFVEGPARGHGLGRALVDAVAGWARARGATQLSLWVTATNEPALALYRRCDFRPTGEAQPLDHTPSLTELRMVREI